MKSNKLKFLNANNKDKENIFQLINKIFFFIKFKI
jgi:hypothetical protein